MREKNDLKENTVRGTIFGALERFSVMGIQIICTFIVARFLTPSDFGLVGLLIVFTVIGNTIVDSGFGQALVREKEVSDLHQRTREGIETARLNGKQIGLAQGTKLVTKKSVNSKRLIQKYSRDFSGILSDKECMKLIGISKGSYYKYKRELRLECSG